MTSKLSTFYHWIIEQRLGCWNSDYGNDTKMTVGNVEVHEMRLNVSLITTDCLSLFP